MEASPAQPRAEAWPLRLARSRLAMPCIGMVVIVYAVFSWMLYRDGVAARAVWVPISPEQYYAVQTAFMAPLMLASAWGFSALAWALSGARRVTPLPPAFQVLGVTWAVPVLVLFVVPDLLVYLVAGHGALAKAMRVYAPLAPLAIVLAATRALRDGYQVPAARAAVAVVAALVVQTAGAAILLR